VAWMKAMSLGGLHQVTRIILLHVVQRYLCVSKYMPANSLGKWLVGYEVQVLS